MTFASDIDSKASVTLGPHRKSTSVRCIMLCTGTFNGTWELTIRPLSYLHGLTSRDVTYIICGKFEYNF